MLDTKHVKHYWLSLGGDIISSGFDTDNQPWKVGIAKAAVLQEPITVVVNASGEHQAVATSGTTKRRGPHWHHLIDPRTGQPAKTDVLTATVVSESATAADVFAKCLAILGSSGAEAFAERHALAGALLQITDHTGAGVIRYGVFA